MQSILLISDEPISKSGVDPATGVAGSAIPIPGISVGSISAICHKADTDEKFLAILIRQFDKLKLAIGSWHQSSSPTPLFT
jgi:hypothetical protein